MNNSGKGHRSSSYPWSIGSQGSSKSCQKKNQASLSLQKAHIIPSVEWCVVGSKPFSYKNPRILHYESMIRLPWMSVLLHHISVPSLQFFLLKATENFFPFNWEIVKFQEDAIESLMYKIDVSRSNYILQLILQLSIHCFMPLVKRFVLIKKLVLAYATEITSHSRLTGKISGKWYLHYWKKECMYQDQWKTCRRKSSLHSCDGGWENEKMKGITKVQINCTSLESKLLWNVNNKQFFFKKKKRKN